ncbi:hypothetical protein [Paenibacillus sp. BC26]|nr:hypothetical protein [Paenibacillus sp. BC26]
MTGVNRYKGKLQAACCIKSVSAQVNDVWMTLSVATDGVTSC